MRDSRVASPPSSWPVGVKLLGLAETGARHPVGLAVADSRFHLHVLGATGVGKTTLLAQLILQDARAGRGAVVIDPKGDLVNDLLDRLPANMAGRLVLIDPAETLAPVALNVLDGSAGPGGEVVVDQLVAVFRRVFASAWGPRSEDILRCAALTVAGHDGATLADVPRILADPTHPARKAARGGDVAGLGGFWAWYDALSDAGRAAAVGPVANKLRAILTRHFAAELLGTAASSFNLSNVLDGGGLLLARLPKGLLGEDTARLVGSLLVAKTWQAATTRADRPERCRPDAALYVDECHNFLALPGSLEDVLAEARGYRLSLVLAHQHLGQLPRELADAISANARNKAYFTCSPEDARRLAVHVGPVLSDYDLAHLGGHRIACRLVHHGIDTAGFTLATQPISPAIPGRAEALRAAGRAFGRTAEARRRDDLARRRHKHRTGGRRVGVAPGVPAGVPPGVPDPPASPVPNPHVTGVADPASRQADCWWRSV
jgi:hypothetical protein